MNCRVGIISLENEILLKEIIAELQRNDLYYHILYYPQEVKQKIDENFKGFFIFCLPPEEVKKWEKEIKSFMNKFFKIFYYHSLITVGFKKELFLQFDFIVVGEKRQKNLSQLLNYLDLNYWRKIPSKIIKGENGEFSPLLQNILFIISTMKDENINIEKIANRLNVKKIDILSEIRKNTGLSFTEFRKHILEYLHQKEN